MTSPKPPPLAEHVGFPIRSAVRWAVAVQLTIVVALIIDLSGWLG